MPYEQQKVQPSNDLKKTAIQTLSQQCFLAMSNEWNTILSGPPIIRKKAKELIPLSIAYVLRNTFSRTRVAYRAALYRKLSHSVHTDRWNDTLKDLNSPAGHFLRKYEDWVNQFPESDRDELKRQLSAILKRISDEFASDFDYDTHPPICELSRFEKAELDIMRAAKIRYTANGALFFKYFHSLLYYSLSFLYFIAALTIVLYGMLVFPVVILLKISPLFLAQKLINFYCHMIAYFMGFYLGQHFSFLQMLLLGEKAFREALRDFIPETELANYLRTLYNPEVNLNNESDARVLLIAKRK